MKQGSQDLGRQDPPQAHALTTHTQRTCELTMVLNPGWPSGEGLRTEAQPGGETLKLSGWCG